MRNKNYYTFNQDLTQHFQEKVYKLTLDGGFSCPNRDGTKGTEGCFYCGETGVNYFGKTPVDIRQQIIDRKKALRRRYKTEKFIAYFQTYTSTYADPKILAAQYQAVLTDPEIVGLAVSTRPDCLSDQVLEILQKNMHDRYHWLEIGLQSMHNETLKNINRGHTFEEFLAAYQKAKALKLRVSVHLILGLPGETEEMMLATIQKMIELKVDGLKFHHLHIIKNSVFEKLYNEGKITLFSFEEYKKFIGRVLPFIPSNIVIHRLFGDAPDDFLVAPTWSKKKTHAINLLDKYLKEEKIFQGGISN